VTAQIRGIRDVPVKLPWWPTATRRRVQRNGSRAARGEGMVYQQILGGGR